MELATDKCIDRKKLQYFLNLCTQEDAEKENLL